MRLTDWSECRRWVSVRIQEMSLGKSLEIGRYYDKKKNDLNFFLSRGGFVHHHAGICTDDFLIKAMSEEEILARLYDWENALTKRAMEYLENVEPGMRVFDAGSGRGGSAFMINEKYGCLVNGVTLSGYQAKFAQEMSGELGVKKEVQFLHADMLESPFIDGSFDAVWACESTGYVPLEKMFTEFGRLLKTGGRLVIVAVCGNPEIDGAVEYIGKINSVYKVELHSFSEYLEQSSADFELIGSEDLTEETIPYWELRAKSKNKTGIENLVVGAKIRALEYRLFCFGKKNDSIGA